MKHKKLYYSTWNGTIWEEIAAYFGLMYLFGLVNKSSYRKHWSISPLVYNPFPSRIMSFTRFVYLKKFLCFHNSWE